jgi:cadmium resistance protein CadD (predicted permease)
MRWLLIGLLLVLSSCSLEHRIEKKFRRAERKIEKLTIRYPQLLKKDTINDTIEITIEQVKVDTIFTSTDGDTVTLYKDKIRIKYFRQGDTVYLSGECQADTIYQIISVPVEQIVVRQQTILEQLEKHSKRIIWFLVILAILYIAIRVLWKFIKPL